jgi:hypothetical protein
MAAARRPTLLVASLAVAVLVALLPASTAGAAAARSDLERRAEDVVVGLHDRARTEPGRFGYASYPAVGALTGWTDLREVARAWSDEMARRGVAHNGGYPGQACCAVTRGENVGARGLERLDPATVSAAATTLFRAWMDSSPHRANVMDGRFDEIGVGARIQADGDHWKLLVTVDFRERDRGRTPPGVVYHRPPRNVSDTCREAGGAGFRDVPLDHAHRAAVDCVTAHGIASGRRDGTYDPAGTVRRGELASFLVRTLAAADVALPDPGEVGDHFDDDDGHAHEDSLDVLAEIGVVDRSDRRIRPGLVVTRAGMVVWTYDALVYAGAVNPGREIGDHCSDDEGRAGQGAANHLADRGVLTGVGDGTCRPGDALRRDQLATLLARGLDLLLAT